MTKIWPFQIMPPEGEAVAQRGRGIERMAAGKADCGAEHGNRAQTGAALLQIFLG